ncbi:hypothetical protein TTHERM_000274648 (macronuclear) [Tetrahymena thermophila SB210]|uniref:Uncharacterized protein n=1 Tax=Tetrahymena thermophila (strain SB210) TaxID=312017 RepID=W7XCV4_TETTS|nr:hypothetical protein TTHERM_000274648 [Tetrahymena thermophila SB210]EWS74403.1 hypothetical protein TTHERM_000274648 [Tetrahymena thermophila SB210]|eukprot:XP_012653080.1 hypothetical protein TTHERM_000274648 [Tetrahymena thermophila SB210]
MRNILSLQNIITVKLFLFKRKYLINIGLKIHYYYTVIQYNSQIQQRIIQMIKYKFQTITQIKKLKSILKCQFQETTQFTQIFGNKKYFKQRLIFLLKIKLLINKYQKYNL